MAKHRGSRGRADSAWPSDVASPRPRVGEIVQEYRHNPRLRRAVAAPVLILVSVAAVVAVLWPDGASVVVGAAAVGLGALLAGHGRQAVLVRRLHDNAMSD